MLSFIRCSVFRSASDRTGLGYGISSSNIASTGTTIFVPPINDFEIDLASENMDNGKSILGAPPKLDKKEAKCSRAKKANSQKPKQKK